MNHAIFTAATPPVDHGLREVALAWGGDAAGRRRPHPHAGHGRGGGGRIEVMSSAPGVGRRTVRTCQSMMTAVFRRGDPKARTGAAWKSSLRNPDFTVGRASKWVAASIDSERKRFLLDLDRN